MKRTTISLFAMFFLIVGCAGTKPPAVNSKTDNFQKIIDNYYNAIDSIARVHPLRIGILPLASTLEQTGDTVNEFGRYIAENLTSRIGSSAQRIKMYERTRLDAIFKENSLSLSGLINEKDAMKIGELVPIDYLFTGTFTVLRQKCSLSGRLIDVTTGEIVFASSEDCNITDDIAELLPQAPEPQADSPDAPSGGSTNENPCAALQTSIDKKVAAANPDDQFSVLIDEAVKIPFDTVCPRIHYDIMERCERANANPAKYSAFLINTLHSIKKPESDYRSEAIFDYFRYDHTIDDNEWAAGCEALGRVRWVDRYLGKLIPGDTLTSVLEKRITDLASRCSRGEVGSPAVDIDNVLLDICVHMGFFSHNTTGSHRRSPKELQRIHDALHLLNKFTPTFTWSIPDKYADYINDLWYQDKSSPLGDTLFTLAADMVSHIKANKDYQIIEYIARTLVDDLFDQSNKSQVPETVAVHNAQLFAEKCRKQIIARTQYVKEQHFSSTDIPALCLFTGIEAPLVPTADSISIWLSSDDIEVASKAAEYAVFMDKRAVVLEDKLIRVLRQRIRKDVSSEYDNGRIIRALGATRTSKPEACELLIGCLDSLNYRFPPSEVVSALALIGKPAIPYIKRYLEKEPDSHAYSTADFFEQLGLEAKTQLPYLEQKSRSIKDSKAKYYLEDAIERIKQTK
jgi:PBP1b-binding outer membrane lipoprotein LpoB